MDETYSADYWDGFRDRLKEAAKSHEVWELVKTYNVYITERDGNPATVLVDLEQFERGGWALFAHVPKDLFDENPRPPQRLMLTNVESSPDAALKFAHWGKIQQHLL